MEPTERFAQLVAGPEASLRVALDEAALLIAAHAYPELDIGAYRGRLDELAMRCGSARLEDVIRYLTEAEGFAANQENYNDPRNSYLNEVLERRVGIPISLSVVLMEVAKRLGITLQGVGTPNRFLVRYDGGGPPVFIDMFGGGDVMNEADVAKRFEAEYAPGTDFEPSYLDAVGPRELVARMLLNLKTVHGERRNARELAWVLRLRVSIPGIPLRERGELAQALVATGRFIDAADVLDEAADLGSGRSSERLRGRARQLRARLN